VGRDRGAPAPPSRARSRGRRPRASSPNVGSKAKGGLGGGLFFPPTDGAPRGHLQAPPPCGRAPSASSSSSPAPHPAGGCGGASENADGSEYQASAVEDPGEEYGEVAAGTPMRSARIIRERRTSLEAVRSVSLPPGSAPVTAAVAAAAEGSARPAAPSRRRPGAIVPRAPAGKLPRLAPQRPSGGGGSGGIHRAVLSRGGAGSEGGISPPLSSAEEWADTRSLPTKLPPAGHGESPVWDDGAPTPCPEFGALRLCGLRGQGGRRASHPPRKLAPLF